MYKSVAILLILHVALVVQGQSEVWVRNFGGAGLDFGESVASNDSGYIFVSGFFSESVDFDPSPDTLWYSSNGQEDGFVSKLNADGELIWALAIGGNTEDRIIKVLPDQSGDVVILGRFFGDLDFNPLGATPALVSAPERQYFLAKYDANGINLWVKTCYKHVLDAVLDPRGHVFLSGFYSGTQDFDPGPGTASQTSDGGDDGYIVQLDENGDYIWVKTFRGMADLSVFEIALGLDNSIHATGSFSGLVDFDPGPTTNTLYGPGERRSFVVKLDSNGHFLWAGEFGGIDFWDSTVRSIAVDRDNHVVLVGDFVHIMDADPGLDSLGIDAGEEPDSYILKLDPFGDLIWVRQIACNGRSMTWDLAVDTIGNVYTAGHFFGSIDFDPGPYELLFNAIYLSEDAFVSKLDSEGNHVWVDLLRGSDVLAAYDIDVADDGAVYTTGHSSGVVYAEAGHLDGFGSADTYVLKHDQCTIYPIDVSTSQTAMTLTANASGLAYQWLDCGNGLAPIAGATGQSFQPGLCGSFAVAIQQDGCIDTSYCVPFGETSLLSPEFQGGGQTFHVFPNPASGSATIKVGALRQVCIEIYTAEGRLLRRFVPQTSLETIPLEGMQGMLFVLAHHENGIAFQKLLVY